MYKKIKSYEKWLNSQLEDPSCDFERLLQLHESFIKWIQNERLVHLIVTLFTGSGLLFSVYLLVSEDSFFSGMLMVLLGALFGIYIIHYFRLENTVQRWYITYLEIWKRLK